MPHVNQDIGCGLARVGVQNSNVKVERNSRLVLAHVLAKDVGVGPEVRSSSGLGDEDARIVLDRRVMRTFGMDGNIRVTTHYSITLGQRTLLALHSECTRCRGTSFGDRLVLGDLTSRKLMVRMSRCSPSPWQPGFGYKIEALSSAASGTFFQTTENSQLRILLTSQCETIDRL